VRTAPRFFLALAITATVVLGSCGGTSEVVLTDTDSTREVSVDAGARIVVRLPSNPTTGYDWRLDEMSTPGLVDLVSREFESSSDDGSNAGDDQQLLGTPGTTVFVFTAGDGGAGVLRLIYIRDFDDPPIPERVVEYILRIDDAPWPPDGAGDDPPATATEMAPGDSSDG
jgi:inhibitor of cysteine peptidase